MYLQIFISFILLFLSCGKDDPAPNIVGKWYQASLSTKNIEYSNCALRDTTKLYIRTDSSATYEFFSDGKLISTMFFFGQKYEVTGSYKLTGNQLTMTLNSSTTPAINLSNISSSGFSMEQDNRYYCPGSTKLGYKEYVNYKKY